MPYLNLKANSQPVQTFYREIKEKQQLSFLHEGAVAPHFSKLLQYCGRQFNWTLIEQYPIARKLETVKLVKSLPPLDILNSPYTFSE